MPPKATDGGAVVWFQIRGGPNFILLRFPLAAGQLKSRLSTVTVWLLLFASDQDTDLLLMLKLPRPTRAQTSSVALGGGEGVGELVALGVRLAVAVTVGSASVWLAVGDGMLVTVSEAPPLPPAGSVAVGLFPLDGVIVPCVTAVGSPLADVGVVVFEAVRSSCTITSASTLSRAERVCTASCSTSPADRSLFTPAADTAVFRAESVLPRAVASAAPMPSASWVAGGLNSVLAAAITRGRLQPIPGWQPPTEPSAASDLWERTMWPAGPAAVLFQRNEACC